MELAGSRVHGRAQALGLRRCTFDNLFPLVRLATEGFEAGLDLVHGEFGETVRWRRWRSRDRGTGGTAEPLRRLTLDFR